jgi:hypothetical protein
MTHKLGERVRESFTTLGTGDITLLGAVNGGRTLASELSTGDTTWMTFEKGNQSEADLITFTAPATVARSTTYRSTSADSAVDFAAGEGAAYIDIPAKVLAGIFNNATGEQINLKTVANGTNFKTGTLIERLGLADTFLKAGRQGQTSPAIFVDYSASSCVTGLKIAAAAAGAGLALSVISSGTNEGLTIDAKGSGTVTIGGTSTGAISLARDTAHTGTNTTTSANAAALAVGPSGATNPTLQVDASTASAATGLKIKGAAAGAGLALSVISSASNDSLTLNALGTGTIGIGSVSTGRVTITPATTITGALTLSATGLVYDGKTLTGSTGTGNMMLSASPTTTGTLTAAIANFSGAVGFSANNSYGSTYGTYTSGYIGDAAALITGSPAGVTVRADSGSLYLAISNNSKLTIAASDGVVRIPQSTVSTSPSTGALVLSGTNAGLGIAGAVNAGGSFCSTQSSATQAQLDTSGSPTIGDATALTSSYPITVNGGNGFILTVIDIVGNSGAIYFATPGAIRLVTGDAVWIAPTTTPGAGSLSVQYDGAVYRIYNNKSTAARFKAAAYRVQ